MSNESLDQQMYIAFRGLRDLAQDGEGGSLTQPALVIYEGLTQSQKLRVMLSLCEQQRRVIRAVLPHLFYTLEN